jgi:O-antigen/teichoic acid export membrane protein
VREHHAARKGAETMYAVSRRTLQVLFGRIEHADPRRRRLIGLLQGVTTSLGNRAISMLVNFLSVPLAIRYLGPELYGAWISLGSLLAWLQLTDFGLNNGLANALTTAVGRDRPDLVRAQVANGFLLLGGIAGITGIVGLLAWPFIDWSILFGVTSAGARSEIGPAVALAFAIFLVQFPFSITSKIYMAYQEGRIANYWGAAGNVLSLLALVIVIRTEGGLPWLVVAVSGTGLVVNVANTAWLLLWHKPFLMPSLRHADPMSIWSLGQISGKFFLLQMMALVTFESPNLVIGYYLGAAHVPEYRLTYTLFNYVLLPQSMLFFYLWAAYNEAIARNDIAWVRRAFRLNLMGGMAFSAVAVCCLALIAKPFIGWWAGPNVVPSASLIAWMMVWSLINAFTNPIASLLAAASHLGAQILYSGIATACNLMLSIYLVTRWGVDGPIAAAVVSYAVIICVPIYADANYLIRKLSRAV